MASENILGSQSQGGRRKFVKTLAAIAGLTLTGEALAACGDTATAPAASATTAAATTAAAVPATTAAAPAATTAAAPAATTAAAPAPTTAANAGTGGDAPAGFTKVGPTSSYKADGDPVAFTANSTKGFVYNKGGTFVVFTEVCTHKGCKVPYNAAEGKFVCPCHNSQFDKSGEVVKGPAATRLPTVEFKVVGDNLFVKA